MAQVQTHRSELTGEDESHPVALPMRLTMSKKTVLIAWVGLLLVAFVAYLDAITALTYSVYALSNFERLSWEGAMMTIQGVIAIGEFSSSPSIEMSILLTLGSHSGLPGPHQPTCPVSFPSHPFPDRIRANILFKVLFG